MLFSFRCPHGQAQGDDQPWETQVTGADQTRLAKRAEALGYDISACRAFHHPTSIWSCPARIIPFDRRHGPFRGCYERLRIQFLHHPAAGAEPDHHGQGAVDRRLAEQRRITVTFGVGWLKEEFDILGVPFHERGDQRRISRGDDRALDQESPCYEGNMLRSRRRLRAEAGPGSRIWRSGWAATRRALKRHRPLRLGLVPFLTSRRTFRHGSTSSVAAELQGRTVRGDVRPRHLAGRRGPCRDRRSQGPSRMSAQRSSIS